LFSRDHQWAELPWVSEDTFWPAKSILAHSSGWNSHFITETVIDLENKCLLLCLDYFYRGEEKVFKNSVLITPEKGNVFKVILYFFPIFLFGTLFQHFQRRT